MKNDKFSITLYLVLRQAADLHLRSFGHFVRIAVIGST
jgi:hypothetical protein